jgi:glycosyltransferase involved in cell wall biosynthesis
LKLTHDVTIINNKNLQEVINQVNSIEYDMVHIMYDDHVIITQHLKCNKLFYTSHYAYITHHNFEETQQWYFKNIFQHVIINKERLILNVISEQIKKVYVNYGFPSNKINVVHNGSREDEFQYHITPVNKNKSIYLAKIEERKKQYIYQCIPNIDFVGNYHNSSFDVSQSNYLGEWNKDKLYSNLSHYGNLVLLSDGEADPLVVKEALISGLGVVVSECASANLDLSKEFITIIPNDKLKSISYVNDAIIKNREISINQREQIREYGLKVFSWKNVINKYNEVIQ